MPHISLLFVCLDTYCQNFGMWKINCFSQSLWHSSAQGGTSSISLARYSRGLSSLFQDAFSLVLCVWSPWWRGLPSSDQECHIESVCCSVDSGTQWEVFVLSGPQPGTIFLSVQEYALTCIPVQSPQFQTRYKSGSTLKSQSIGHLHHSSLSPEGEATKLFGALLLHACPGEAACYLALICAQRSPGIQIKCPEFCQCSQRSKAESNGPGSSPESSKLWT